MFINTDHYITTLHYIIPYYMFSCFLLTFKSTSMFIAVTSDRSNQVIIFLCFRCSLCVSTDGICGWCQLDFTCTGDNSTCTGGDYNWIRVKPYNKKYNYYWYILLQITGKVNPCPLLQPPL